MKIKVINPVPTLEPSFVDAMTAYLNEAVLPETQIEFVFVKKGFLSIETETQGIINGAEILKTVAALQDDDCDGIFINCFDDPALLAAREISKKPVLGPYASSISLAQMLGEKIGIITTDRYGLMCEERKAKSHGFTGCIAAVKPVDLTVLALNENDLIERLSLCCMELEKEQITTVVLGCTGMNQAAEQLQAALRKKNSRVQIIEPLKTGVKLLELMIQMRYTSSIPCTPIQARDYVEM